MGRRDSARPVRRRATGSRAPAAGPNRAGEVTASGNAAGAQDSPWQRSYAAWRRAGIDWQSGPSGPGDLDLQADTSGTGDPYDADQLHDADTEYADYTLGADGTTNFADDADDAQGPGYSLGAGYTEPAASIDGERDRTERGDRADDADDAQGAGYGLGAGYTEPAASIGGEKDRAERGDRADDAEDADDAQRAGYGLGAGHTGPAASIGGEKDRAERGDRTDDADDGDDVDDGDDADGTLAAGGRRGGVRTRPRALRRDRPRAAAFDSQAQPRARRRASLVATVVALAVVVGAGGAFALLRGDRSGNPAGAVTVGEWIFAADPSATTDGRVQELRGVAAAGSTVVAVGAEIGGDYSRAQFLVSTDGGRGWRLARVRAADGGEPPAGEFPDRVSAGPRGWTALGGSDTRRVVWTSDDGRTWTRQAGPDSSVFGAGDRINAIARADSGFVAVGTTPARRGATRAVAWTSADGRTWRRLAAGSFPTAAGTAPGRKSTTRKSKAGGDVVRLEHAAASGATVVAHGTIARKRAQGGAGRGGRRVVEREAFWRSTNGGATWTRVAVPQAQGSYGTVDDVVAGPGGFYTAREAKRAAGKGKRRHNLTYAVVWRSTDGAGWRPAGQVQAGGYNMLDRLSGSAQGLAALVTVRGGHTVVLRSGDGASWQPAGQIERHNRRRVLTGAAVLPSVTVVTGRQGLGDDAGAFLSVAGGAGGVDLGRIPDAVHVERRVTEVAAHGGTAVAVGSANGQAAAWHSPDGGSWSRAGADGGVFGGAGQQRLLDVVPGGRGWLAVGSSGGSGDAGDTGRRPLVAVSSDGRRWHQPTGTRAFDRPRSGELIPYGVAYGPHGYVVVGERVAKRTATAVAWHSVDPTGATGWTTNADAGRAGTSMHDVAVSSGGFAAVGTQTRAGASLPAAWTSTDGAKWKAVAVPPPLPPGSRSGGLDRVVARGDTLVAVGWADDPHGTGSFAYLAVSSDGGTTWRRPILPGVEPVGPVSAVTATRSGFVAAAVSGNGGRDHIVLWTSADGAAWRAQNPPGRGLTGPGTHLLTGLTPYGDSLLAVGFTGDHRRDHPLLWRPPLPRP